MRWPRTAAVALLATLAGITTLAVAIGAVSAVVTSGTSMEPRIHSGDLVVVRAASTYTVGDAVAYHSDQLDTVVLHRIMKIRDGRYTLRGDNNSWLDPERPTENRLIGKELLHIPQGGIWLDRLTSPVALGVLAFCLLAVGGNTARTRRGRLRRATVSQHAARPTRLRSIAGLPPWAKTTAAVAAVAGVLGMALAFAAWTTPATPVTATNDAAAPGQQMTFSYTAEVDKSPAYDDTTVTAPEPVFRKLTDSVEVNYTYTGAPGTVNVAADLSTVSGWTSTVPLKAAEPFGDRTNSGTVSLELDALDRRAQAAATAIGIPAGEVAVKVVTTVTTAHGEFTAALPLTLSPLKLTLTGDTSALKVGDATETGPDAPPTSTLNLAGHEIPVTTARVASLAMGTAALLAAMLVVLLTRFTAPATEFTAIRRRYGQMLIEVEPTPTPAGRPVVDVLDFATLAKLAERYELLVMHWSRAEVDTFMVQDQATTYRYRTGTGLGQPLNGRSYAEPRREGGKS